MLKSKIKIVMTTAVLGVVLPIYSLLADGGCFAAATRICHLGTAPGMKGGPESVTCSTTTSGSLTITTISDGSVVPVPTVGVTITQQSCEYTDTDGTVPSYMETNSGLSSHTWGWPKACKFSRTYASTCCGANVVGPFGHSEISYQTRPRGKNCPQPG